MNKNIRIIAVLCCVATLLASCTVKQIETEDQTVELETSLIAEERIYEARLDPNVFNRKEPLRTIEKNIAIHTYEGAKEKKQNYTLNVYRNISDFDDVYGEKEFKRIEFEYADTYDYFYALCMYKQYLFFLVEEAGIKRVFRYDLSNETTEDIFSYNGDNQITLAAVNDRYLIWQEDENSNWLKVSINCYDMINKTNEKVYTYPRDDDDKMFSWNFDKLVLEGEHLYFDSVVSATDDKANINLYRYSPAENKTELVYENRGAQPLIYKGVSWLSFDDVRKEYVIRNLDEAIKPIYIGMNYIDVYASKNYIVGFRSDIPNAIMYFDGTDTIPIIETTGNFDSIYCTDRYIMWNGWSNDYPMFYDIKKDIIVYNNVLEYDRQYTPYLSEDYMVFEANDFVADTAAGEGAVKTRALIFYYIATDELR